LSFAAFDSSSLAATPDISSLNPKFTKSPLSSRSRKGAERRSFRAMT